MIRRISREDKQRILEISANIWEGDDYIAQIFDKWVVDDGVFAGLWEDDILVGFGKLTWLTSTDVWLEGLRKDEASGAINVGKKLAKYYFNYLKGKKITSIRFSTYFGNIASIKLNESLGFKKILELSLKSKKISQQTDPVSAEITNDIDFETLRSFVEKSSYLNDTKGFISKGWIIHKYSKSLLLDFYNAENYIVVKQQDEIAGCALWSNVHYSNVFWISFLQVKNWQVFQAIVNFLESLNQSSDYTELQILVGNSKLLEYCEKLGFTSWERNNDFQLYELPQAQKKITGLISDS